MPSFAAGPRKWPFCALYVRTAQLMGSPQPAETQAMGTHALSSVQVSPERYVRSGTLFPSDAFPGRKRLKFATSPPSASDCGSKGMR